MMLWRSRRPSLEFGRNAVAWRLSNGLSSVCVKTSGTEFGMNIRIGLESLFPGEVQQIERGKIVVMLNRSPEADAIVPWKEQNPTREIPTGRPDPVCT